MERRLKERLTGAAILVMLGVIFIPMILTDSARRDTRIEETNIPERPDTDFDSRVVPLDQPRESAPAPPAPEPVAEPAPAEEEPEPVPAEAAAAASEEVPATVEAGADTAGKAAAPVESEAADKAEAAQTAAPKQTPAKPEKSPAAASGEGEAVPKPDESGQAARGLTAWVVQLGSFSQEDNARGLAQRLQEDGYPAFIEPLQKDGETIYRVRVGPELLRSDANSLRDKLQKEVELEGMVLQYP